MENKLGILHTPIFLTLRSWRYSPRNREKLCLKGIDSVIEEYTQFPLLMSACTLRHTDRHTEERHTYSLYKEEGKKRSEVIRFIKKSSKPLTVRVWKFFVFFSLGMGEDNS